MSFSFYCKPVTATVTVTVDTMEAFDMEAIVVEDSLDSLLAEFGFGEDATATATVKGIDDMTWEEFDASEMARLATMATADLLADYADAMETYYYHINSTGFKMKSQMALAERIEQTIDGRVKDGEVVDGWTVKPVDGWTIKVS